MLYPLWGTSYLAGTVGPSMAAILFVFAALTTCGLGLANAWLLRRAHITENSLILRFLGQNASRIVLLPLAATIALLLAAALYAVLTHPVAVSAVVHTFMWLIALCGIACTVQAVAAYAYIAGGNVLERGQLRIVAYAYALSSWTLVVAIAAVTSFMLTPGTWLATYSFWDALINPTFMPSLVIISIGAVCCGSIFLNLIANASRTSTPGEKGDLEALSMRPLWTLAIAVPVAPLYFMSLPETLKPFAFDLSTSPSLFLVSGAIALILVGALLGISFISRTGRLGLGGSFAAAAALLVAIASLALFQANARGPYAISGYLYSNDIAVADLPRLRREGLLNAAHWIVPAGTDITKVPPRMRGLWVYDAMGYARYPALDVDRLAATTAELGDELRGYYLLGVLLDPERLPPFAGTAAEFEDLIAYLVHPTEEGS